MFKTGVENMILTTQWFGTFLMERGDDRNDKATSESKGRIPQLEIFSMELFPKDPEEIAERLGALRRDEILDEERELLSGLSEQQRSVLKGDDERLSEVCLSIVRKIELSPSDFGYDTELLHEATVLLSTSGLKEGIEKDKHIIQAIDLIDELNKQKNVLCERLEEWYNIYFPEAVSAVEHDDLVKAVLRGKDREEVASAVGKPALAEDHTGSDVGEEEYELYNDLSDTIRRVADLRKRTNRYIEDTMNEIGANLSNLVGPMIGARLISLSGSLKDLARSPASTIQMLGAEKALFRFLKKKGTPPKHGVIFLHPKVHSAPYWQRGNIARTFANKIALAARADHYTGRDISEDLIAQLDKRIEEIQKKYPRPPKKPKGRRKRRGRRRGKGR